MTEAPIHAVLFDLDGVLTDTAAVHAATWKRLFDGYSAARVARGAAAFAPFDADSDYRTYVDGKPRYDGVASFLAARGIDLPHGSADDPPDRETICGLGNRKNVDFNAWLDRHGIAPLPGAAAFLDALRTRGVARGLFSSSRNARRVLTGAGLIDRFDAIVDGTDSARLGLPGKPDPAIIHEAARQLGVAPSHAAVIEDARAGIQAGRAGGYTLVIGVAAEGPDSAPADALRGDGADFVVQDLAALSPDAPQGDPAARFINRLRAPETALP